MPIIYIPGDGSYWIDGYTGEKTKVGPIDPTQEPGYVHQSASNNNSTSSSTTQNYQDPRALDIQLQQVQQQHTDALNAYDLAVRQGDRVAATAAADRLARTSDLLVQLQSVATNQANQNVFTGGENAKNRQATSDNQQAQNVFTAGQQQGQNVFTSGERLGSQAFQAGESALSRAQRAGEFAATYAIQRAEAERQQRDSQLGAAKTFTELSASPDLTGWDRFMAAGGGSLGGAIQRGANSFTPRGQLGAARALQTARETPRELPDYVPFTGTNPYINSGGYQPPGPTQGAAPVKVTPQADVPTNPTPFTVNYQNGVATTSMGAGSQAQTGGYDPALAAAAVNAPRYALGTASQQLGRRVREPSVASPAGSSIDAVSDRYARGTRLPVGPLTIDPNADLPPGYAQGTGDGYAHGTFVTGDSTDPADPAAGGAHPEQVSIMDPPGPDNAEASVTPLTPPGVGDTTDGDGGVGALLIAIGRFLDAQEAKAPLPPQRFALGSMRRYATGTDLLGDGIMESDQPYVNEVLGMRLGTPYSVDPYKADYFQSSPTQRAIDSSAFQTATGVPGTELAFEADKYKPGGMARNSTYAREFSLGL